MEILHLKLCDFDLTFKGHTSSQMLYDFLNVFLISFSHTCFVYEKQPAETSITSILHFNVIQGQML